MFLSHALCSKSTGNTIFHYYELTWSVLLIYQVSFYATFGKKRDLEVPSHLLLSMQVKNYANSGFSVLLKMVYVPFSIFFFNFFFIRSLTICKFPELTFSSQTHIYHVENFHFSFSARTAIPHSLENFVLTCIFML